jgi:predicted RND superfamily exporter protein
MLDRVKHIIETKHQLVLFIIISFTLLFAMFVPSVEFRTEIEEFYPENDAVKADRTIEDHFGHDPLLQYIYVSPGGDDPDQPDGTVLSLPALQEEYNITRTIRSIEGVVGTISVAEYFHTYLSLNESLGFGNGSLFQDTNWTTLRTFITDLSSTTSLEQYFYLQKILIHKDWNPTRTYLEGKAPEADGTLIIVEINASLNTEDRKILANEIRETVKDMPLLYVETEHTGADLMAYQVDEVSNQTLMYLAGAIVVLITIILYLSFRKMSYVFLPLLTLILAIIWTLGTMVMIGLEFTALDVAVLPLLIGLGIDDAVHVSRRYQEELRRCEYPTLAMAVTMKSIGTAIFLTSLTTIIAFLSNGFSGVKPVRDFGIVCAIGISYAFILTVTFYVGMRYWLDKRGGDKIMCNINGEGPYMDALISKMSATIDSRPRAVVLFVIFITILSAYGATSVRTEFDVEEFLPEDLPSMQTTTDIGEDFEGGRYTTTYVLYEGDDLATVQTMDVLDQTSVNIKDDTHLVNISVFIATGDLGIIRRSYQITTPLTVIGMAIDDNPSLAERYNFTSIEVKKELRDKWLPNHDATDADVRGIIDFLYENETETDPISGNTYGSLMRSVVRRSGDGSYNAILIRMAVNARSSDESRKVYDELEDDKVAMPGAKSSSTGTVVLLIQTVDSIQSSQIKTTIVAIFLAAVILCFIYKDLQLGFISIIPVGLNVTWILGTMAFVSFIHDVLESNGWWNPVPTLSLNVLTVTVTSLSIGLGIDYAIHVVQRFRENLTEESLSVQEAIHSTLEHTGSALFISAVTTVAGFGVLIFAPMPLIKMFGIITAASIVFSLLSTTLFLPILLVYWAKHHGHFTLHTDIIKGFGKLSPGRKP